jgi:probable F420-dependent oxidoreductase
VDIGFVMPTHGLLTRDERDFFLQRVEPDQVRAFEFARFAEQLGYHSLWFSDHVVMGRDLQMRYPANLSGTKAYPQRPTMLDVVAVMGGLCAVTSRIRFAPSVHIAPYRHPLSSAHQFATIDQLSHGRLIVGVGPGWEVQEFAALGADFERKGAYTEEAVAVYKAAWTQDFVDFDGRFFCIHDVSMEPKPHQRPHPPLVWGGTTELGARRAVRCTDGLYTVHLDPYPGVSAWRTVKEAAMREGERIGRDLSDFWYGSFCSALITDADDPLARSGRRPTLTGTAAQILEELATFAAEGYQHVTLHPHVRSGAIDEFFEQAQRLAEEVLPEARRIPTRPFG